MFPLIRNGILFLIAFAFLISSCKKETFIQGPDALISFSTDTLFFDTVFTSVGSATDVFKIINLNDQKLKLSSIRLAGGSASPFKLNINGKPGYESTNEIMNANDSMYVFVQVFVKPDDRTQPFILEDSIEVRYNGQSRWMQLRAFGQNAIFLKNKTIPADTVWNNLLPVVVSGFLRVEENATLKIEKGTSVYVHATAPVIVDGTLHAEGKDSSPVIFRGDRRDADYRDLPAAWPGIYFTASSQDNLLQSVVLKNAYQGVIAEQMAANGNPKVTITRSRIENIYDAGILALNSSIRMDNSLIANCGSNVSLLLGGDYSFVNCTVATFGSFFINHKTPVFQAVDYYKDNDVVFTADLNLDLINCIVWGDNGSVDNELFFDKKGSGVFNVVIDHSIYKAKDNIPYGQFMNSYLNAPPLFDSINTSKNYYDFRINNPQSPAIKSGKPVSFLYDLDGKPRENPPDIGCYER